MTEWFDRIQKWYGMGLWTAAMVQDAVDKGKLTQAQYDEITANLAQ